MFFSIFHILKCCITKSNIKSTPLFTVIFTRNLAVNTGSFPYVILTTHGMYTNYRIFNHKTIVRLLVCDKNHVTTRKNQTVELSLLVQE